MTAFNPALGTRLIRIKVAAISVPPCINAELRVERSTHPDYFLKLRRTAAAHRCGAVSSREKMREFSEAPALPAARALSLVRDRNDDNGVAFEGVEQGKRKASGKHPSQFGMDEFADSGLVAQAIDGILNVVRKGAAQTRGSAFVKTGWLVHLLVCGRVDRRCLRSEGVLCIPG